MPSPISSTRRDGGPLMSISWRRIFPVLLCLALLVVQLAGLVHGYTHGTQAKSGQAWVDPDPGEEGACGLCLALSGMGNGVSGRGADHAGSGQACLQKPTPAVCLFSTTWRAYAARAPPWA